MKMTEWAKNEIKLACEREKGSEVDDGFGAYYGCACYESAYKAFKSLCKDGHSGMSINITKAILNRLIDGKPLTPIYDTPDVWSEIADVSGHRGEVVNYQCKRMSSLFKYVYADGSVKYYDINRIISEDIDSHATYHNGFISNLIDEMYPITMPYCANGEYRVITSDFLYDSVNEDFDTIAIHKLIKPDGEVELINRYFKESDTGYVEIGEYEYYSRKIVSISNTACANAEKCEEDDVNE